MRRGGGGETAERCIPRSRGCVVRAVTKYTLGAVKGGEKPRRRWLLRREKQERAAAATVVVNTLSHPFSPSLPLYPYTRRPYTVKTLVYISNTEGLNDEDHLSPSCAHTAAHWLSRLFPRRSSLPGRQISFFPVLLQLLSPRRR